MKYMYQCEKCKSFFDDSALACQCESSHCDAYSYINNDYTAFLAESEDHCPVYKRGQKTPAIIYIPMTDSDGKVYIGKYERSAVMSEETTDFYIQKKQEADERQRIWWEEYKKKQEAKKQEEEIKESPN